MTGTPVRRIARVVFGVAGGAFMLWAFVKTAQEADTRLLPSWPRFLAALFLGLVGLCAAVQAWMVIAQHRGRRLAFGFYTSQLGKYIPGGVWQAVGQIGSLAPTRAEVPRATTAFFVFSLTQAAAGAAVGCTLVATRPNLSASIRIAALGGVGALLLLDRRWMVRGARLVARLTKRRAPESELVPAQKLIWLAFLWSLIPTTCAGAAYWLLLDEISSRATGVGTISAFAAAWTVGFVALPFPAGLGVREALLVATLAPQPTAAVVAASAYQRLVLITAEALMVVGTSVYLHVGQPREEGAGTAEGEKQTQQESSPSQQPPPDR